MEKMCIIYSREELKSVVKELINDQKKDEEPEVFLTTEEASKLLKVSRPTLHRWRKAEIIPSVKVGGNVRYSKTKLIEYLNS